MKRILLLMVTCFLITGCSVVRIDTKSITNIINVVMEKENTLYNRVGKGYKYYIPRGVTYIDTEGLNDVLYADGIYYYLYVDVPSYVNKIESDFEKNTKAYYSDLFTINDKKGYVEILEKDDKYLIKFTYNYASFEALVDENKINSVITDAAYILASIKYNDKIIEFTMDDDYLNIESQYNEFVSNGSSGNFLKAPDEEIDVE